MVEDRVDLGVDLRQRLAGIVIQPQVDDDGAQPRLARRGHVIDAARLRDGVFERGGDEAGDDVRVGAGIGRRDRDDRVLRARILQNRKRKHRLQAEHQNHQADDDRQHRAADEYVGEVHGVSFRGWRASLNDPAAADWRPPAVGWNC